MRRTGVRARRASPRRRTAPQEGADWWLMATELLLNRCFGKCERCWTPLTEPWERHHRRRRRDGGDRLSNLLALHRRCHTYITEHPEEARANGWIIPIDDTDTADAPVRIAGHWWLLDDNGTRRPMP